MSLLEKVYQASKENLKGANIVIRNAGEELGLNIKIGVNFKWCTDTSQEEQAVNVTDDLVQLFDKNNISYSDCLKEDFLNIREDDTIDVFISDESGTYLVNLYAGYLELNNDNYFDYWIDFNEIRKY